MKILQYQLLLMSQLSYTYQLQISCTNTDQVHEKSIFLWSIERNNIVEGYMFGTIHVPFTEVWEQVSEKVKTAFSRSDSVVFELDLYNANTIERLSKCKNIPGGGTVKDYLSPKLYRRLEHYMRIYRKRLERQYNQKENLQSKSKIRNRPRQMFENIIEGWERRRPVWLLFMLYQLSENYLYREHIPMLDLFLAQYALELNKKLYSIETATEQCNPLRSVRMDQLLFAINYTLSYLEFEHNLTITGMQSNSSGIVNLINSYKCGSLDESLFSSDSKRFIKQGFSISIELDRKAQEIDEQLREDIIEWRNIRMADRISKLLQWKVGNQYFFALGAGHFLGRKSILALLGSHGFITKAVTENDEISFREHENDRQVYVFNELWVRDDDIKTDPAIDIMLTVAELPNRSSGGSQIIFIVMITISLITS
ncbi:unnamed protein product [Cercopithifilaria johnstoni]|uniref:Metalloprotease TIKI homolog n=1 Tax=Cercopithifilaria johnstoni TaxID=2874296 RepID=A0A8J2Q5P8_9BILA|nr:unnamed protein product [Cercopithifilaria johnstoni]